MPARLRDAELARPRTRNGKARVNGSENKKLVVEKFVETPGCRPDDDWHPVARMVWDSYVVSPLTEVSVATDWAYLYFACQAVSDYMTGAFSRYAKGGDVKKSALALSEVNKMLDTLLFTESARLKVRLELQHGAPSGLNLDALLATQLAELEAGEPVTWDAEVVVDGERA